MAKAQGIAEITVPSEVIVMDAIPLLASGKTDYPALAAALALTTPGHLEAGASLASNEHGAPVQ